ncbi:MAG: DNA polymerase III subunit alpha [Patescibacteria group bacterium]
MATFTHLHTHSHYSLLNALPQIPELVGAAKRDKMEALALTDSGNLYGAIKFYKECQKEGIKPIIGVDAYLALRTRFDKQSGIDSKRHRLVLLAKDKQGYRNLIRIVTSSFLEGFYYKPRADLDLLEKNREGLLAIIPSFSGDVSTFLKEGRNDEALERLKWYKSTFGNESVFIEITHHPEIPNHPERMNGLIEFARETSTPLVAAHDVYYMKPEDRRTRETVIAIQTNRVVSEESDLDNAEDFSFITQKQAKRYFKDIPEALDNTQKIVDMCNVEIDLGVWIFPEIEMEDGKDHDDALRDMAYEGIKKKGLEKTDEIVERLEYELDIIKTKGYSTYFLIVGDLLRYAKENDILTTIRGSVAGSLVTYLSGITNLNPLEYGLRFERFLNPDRPSAPDIDMDFADNRRDEVIKYAKEKYGEDKVAQIGTFGTMMARGSVRDVARALGYPYSIGDRIAKLIPMGQQGMSVTIKQSLKDVPDLKKLYTEDNSAREILDMAQKIEGLARHISVHAAGVVMSPDPLTNHVPLQMDNKAENKIITQYDMHSVEDAGLIKFDFLGLKNLAILSNALKVVKKYYGTEIDIENIPLDDEKTFEILARGETTGLFQLNGTGMTRFLMELKPTSIHDINAMVALYRPGPMEFIPEYIKRKHNPELVEYPHESLQEILKKSYGLLIYQEDVMMTAIKLAGYSWLEADKFRKAMGKKIPELMKEQEKRFKDGCVENEIPQKTADDLWERIKPFALYAFNKAHSASYGRVAYQTAYMKANYPAIYMSAVLTADSGDVEKIAEIVDECQRMKIAVLPPDVNESLRDFTVVKNKKTGKDEIRFGLNTIKNFGKGISETIIKERKENGPFTSLTDFISRVNDRNLNKKSLEALIKSGALDKLGDRGQLSYNIDRILTYKKELSQANSAQGSLFGDMGGVGAYEIDLEEAPVIKKSEKLSWEKELLGVYLSGHPLDEFKEIIERCGNTISDIKRTKKENATVKAVGLLREVKTMYTKKGDKMMFATLSDYDDSIEIVCFPSTFDKYGAEIEQETCVGIRGKMSNRNETKSIIIDYAKKLDRKPDKAEEEND